MIYAGRSFLITSFFLITLHGLHAEDDQEGQNISETEHHLSIGLGLALVENTILTRACETYLSKSVPRQRSLKLKYQYYGNREADFTSGFAATYLRASSTGEQSYSFGDVRVNYLLHGIAAGLGFRHRLGLQNLYLGGSVQGGISRQDIEISTPVANVKYDDFDKRRDFSDLFLLFTVGGRWDFWRTLGVRADLDYMIIATGTRLYSITFGVGYGI